MIANTVSKNDDYVKHIFREHNLTNVRVIDRTSNADTWKAVEGFFDGSCRDNGKSGCGWSPKESTEEDGS